MKHVQVGNLNHFPLVILTNYIKELKSENTTSSFEEFMIDLRETFRDKIEHLDDESIKVLYDSYYK
ncbi:hypothetical protein SAMN04487895_101693 [Paenibacillus sophorae]|uniref:Uncharacterized protein n=1 Tax=Paenibacillus sophorae TaxID=1333845 RepID=A0A1H8H079_9BACL|nr:hypothetical protein SAMN04487895_101693 [Paenibacillus sophorae]